VQLGLKTVGFDVFKVFIGKKRGHGGILLPVTTNMGSEVFAGN
jgi:hypothetical protein